MHPYRSNDYTQFREQLIQYFEFKLGYRIQNISDCHRAAQEMRARRVSISAHTIARLFKIIGPSTTPYKSTLDLIAKFCGLISFDYYVESFDKTNFPNSIELQLFVNSNNARIESALKLAFQTIDAQAIHQLVEQFEEDPYNLWLQNCSSLLYGFESSKRLVLLDILSRSDQGRKYFYEFYVNENDPDGSYSFALEAYYTKNSSNKNAELFTHLFQSIQKIYRGVKLDSRSIKKVNYLKYNNPIPEFGFHLASRIRELQILLEGPHKTSAIFKWASNMLIETNSLSLYERTWYFARILRAFSFLKSAQVLLNHTEFRLEIEKCYTSQSYSINYPPLMIIQTCLHAYWRHKQTEHEQLFGMHHPLFAQNELNSISTMEAFGVALYDNTLIGNSIKRNLPLVLKSNGVLWMEGLLPVLNN